ncbi:MAG TPA: TlpA disulfide reductase family protein [Steroidobacteraceae bacterium]|nr:TlpA disulfide reductase family protein [Steroidobacteraceae bacterium]
MQNRITAAALLAALVALALPAWAAADAAADSVAPAAAPAFTLQSTSGQQVSLAQFKGDVVMINFWASWCSPCRQEMPLLDSIYRKYKDMGFELIGVNVEPDPKSANAWLKATPVSYPILYDPQSKVSQLYQVQAMPTTVIIDRSGTVRFLHRGYLPGDENAYLNSIRSLIVQ